MPTKGLIQQGGQVDNSTVKRGMVNDNTALYHHLFQISQTQGISQIPANTLSDDIDRIMQAIEGFSDQGHRQAASQKTACYLTTP